MISNVATNSYLNMITCNVDGDSYELAFDNGGTLCEVIINGVANSDYDEDLIDSIISASM
jgi:hypothetical protein